MSVEIPKLEQSNISSEQQAVTDLSSRVTEALDAQGVIARTLEDGSQIRKIEVTPHFGPTLAETTAPDGTKHYEATRLFAQSHDRGLQTWSWQESDSSVDYIGKMEIAGDSTATIGDETGIKKIQADIDYVVSQLPEKSAQQKGRFARVFGKLAMRQ